MNPASQIESILFAAGDSVSWTELSQAAGAAKKDVREAVEELASELTGRGIRAVFDEAVVQLVTAPEHAGAVARYRQSELRGKLSPAALETLAIVAYRGPVTRPVIDGIRGVQSAAPVRTLSVRGLIREAGRSTDVGRPILYETTVELWKHLGIGSRDELPMLPPEHEQRLRAAERNAVAE